MANLAEAIVRRDVLVGRLFANAIAAFDLFSVYLGDVLGLYRVLAERGPLTSAELADEAGVDERYAREWLEQQAASELLEVAHDGDTRRFWLAAGTTRRCSTCRASTTSHRWRGRSWLRYVRSTGCSRRSEAGTACPTPTTATTCTRPRPPSRGPCSRTCREGVAAGGSRDP
jgi:hypothetical protein